VWRERAAWDVVFFGSFFIAFMRLLPRLVLASSAVPRGVPAALAILLDLMAVSALAFPEVGRRQRNPQTPSFAESGGHGLLRRPPSVFALVYEPLFGVQLHSK
jgi:hypothetical protein